MPSNHHHAFSHNKTTTTNNKSSPKKRRRLAAALTSDKALLRIFLASVVIVSVSILLVPLRLEESSQLLNEDPVASQPQHHSVTTQLQKHTAETQSIQQEQHSAQQQQKPLQSTIEEKKDYFRTHSSPYHIIFSSGCSTFQDWQSYVFFYHVLLSGQEGHVTRIASGCSSSTEEKSLHDIFAEEIESMRPGYHHLHLTPDFSNVPKKVKKPFKYFNKPFGVRHWMEHALGYPDNHELHDDSVIILLDPDQILLRPFTRDFSNASEVWRLKHEYRNKPIDERPHIKTRVEHGSPFSQQYG